MIFPVRPYPSGPSGDEIADEEPLEIRVEGRTVAVTMRSPGQDRDLVTGFLWTEGVIDGMDDLRALAEVGPNVVDVRLAEGVDASRFRSAERSFFANSACGICGSAATEKLSRKAPQLRAWNPAPDLLLGLSAKMEEGQTQFGRTGGMHAAALFDGEGRLFCLREDVGRHNAMDKVLGAALQEEKECGELGMVVSSRIGFELVQKCWVAGVPVLVAFGAPTSLAITTAKAAGMKLVGWLRSGRYVEFSGVEGAEDEDPSPPSLPGSQALFSTGRRSPV